MTLEKNAGTENKLITKYDFAKIEYDGAALLSITWKRQVDFQERVEVFMWALQFSIENKVTSWLLNDEEIFIITSPERDWIVQEWPPLAAQAGIRKIAVLLPDAFGNTLLSLTDFTKAAQEHYKKLGVTSHEVFTDYQSAMDWLKAE